MHNFTTGMTRVRGAFILAIGFAALLSSAIWLYWTVNGAVTYQEHVLAAENARNAVFRDQIDAETGLRGFTSTHDIDFLKPYSDGQRDIERDFAWLKLRLAALGTPRLIRLVDDEHALHERWHEVVAAPLLARASRTNATALLQQGRLYVNRFRADDRDIDAGIGSAAADADNAVNIAVARIAIVTGVLGLGFALLYFSFSSQRARMSAETSRARSLYENEKRIADGLQAAFVQKALPQIPSLGFHASYIPAGAQARVGGDWYDAFELPDGRILFSIGDVAGHGIEAAVIMSRARQAIISNALHTMDPAVVLERANESLMLQEPKMVTAICGYIDPGTREIIYATAGHPPPVLAAPGDEPRFLEHAGIPLGIFDDASYESFSVRADEGALLVLYTDGVIEHKRDLAEGQRRLVAAVAAVVRDGSNDPAWSIRHAVFGDAPPDDDVAIMTVSFVVRDQAPAAALHAFAPHRLSVAATADGSLRVG